MKKTIPKPTYWQDFEDLCKKLWGAEWEIPSKIKKNGRSGDDQSGVDVYGKPKGSSNYWGIQCKGKDEFTGAKLTKQEVDEEINKAKNFTPKLEVFIFATTANKNAGIEEYVRTKDIELQKDHFEVLLFDWEDICDLLEDHPNILQWYLDKTKHVTKFDFHVLFDNWTEELIVHPKMVRKTTKYVFTEKTIDEQISEAKKALEMLKIPKVQDQVIFSSMFRAENINHSWIDVVFILENNGQSVIEDWSFKLWFTSGVAAISNGADSFTGVSWINVSKDDPRYIDKDSKSVSYRPIENSVLVQKSSKGFEASILPELNTQSIEIEWEIIARDFSKEGKINIQVEPDYIDKTIQEEAFSKDEEKEDINIEYYTTENR